MGDKSFLSNAFDQAETLFSGTEQAQPDLQPYGNAAAQEALMGNVARAHPLESVCGPESAKSPGETISSTLQTVLGAGLTIGGGLLAGPLGAAGGAAIAPALGASALGRGIGMWGAGNQGNRISKCAPYVTRERNGMSYEQQHDAAAERALSGTPEPDSKQMDYLDCLDLGTGSLEDNMACQEDIYGE